LFIFFNWKVLFIWIFSYLFFLSFLIIFWSFFCFLVFLTFWSFFIFCCFCFFLIFFVFFFGLFLRFFFYFFLILFDKIFEDIFVPKFRSLLKCFFLIFAVTFNLWSKFRFFSENFLFFKKSFEQNCIFFSQKFDFWSENYQECRDDRGKCLKNTIGFHFQIFNNFISEQIGVLIGYESFFRVFFDSPLIRVLANWRMRPVELHRWVISGAKLVSVFYAKSFKNIFIVTKFHFRFVARRKTTEKDFGSPEIPTYFFM